MTLSLLKVGCLCIYAMAIAGAAGLLPGRVGGALEMVAGVMLALHALELALAWKYVRLYRGPIGVSVGLTLVFGVLHWKPLADARARGEGA